MPGGGGDRIVTLSACGGLFHLVGERWGLGLGFWVREGSLARAIGSGLGLGLGSDVCQGGGDRIVTLKVVFLHFIWWERGKLRVWVVCGLSMVHWPEL